MAGENTPGKENNIQQKPMMQMTDNMVGRFVSLILRTDTDLYGYTDKIFAILELSNS